MVLGKHVSSRGATHRCEQGSGSVLALAICAVMIVLAAVTYLVISATLASAVATRAADLAALAGADAARGLASGYPCDVARSTAERNAVRLERCDIGGEHGTEVTVEVSLDAQYLPDGITTWLEVPGFDIRAVTRAGPPPGAF